MPATFDLSNEKNLESFNSHLELKSYVDGYTPSQNDVETFKTSTGAPDKKFPHVARWWKHISSFSEDERKSWPSSGAASAAPAAASAEAEDDFDLFGDETEEEETEREKEIERRAQEALAKKAASGKKVVLKSAVVIDVKPWDDETDLAVLESKIREISMPGLEWKAAKRTPIGYGIFKLQISCHVEDDVVSVDEICEKIQDFEDFVQSTDISTFTKL